VRFIQIFHRGWDAHNNLPKEHESQCKDIDQACAALIKDLKQRGLLDDTLVVWGGEFGRTAYCQGKLTETNYGRDHHPRCFTSGWPAAASNPASPTAAPTTTATTSPTPTAHPFPQPQKEKWTPGTMHIHDLNATILHLLGIDHRKLTYRYQGRDFRLTDIHGHVIEDLIAASMRSSFWW
jgi:arylsulfatase A-like enzyme